MVKDKETHGTFDSMFDNEAGEGESSEDTPVTPNLPALYSDQPDFSPDDVQIPRLRLAQGLSREVQDGTARPGQWLLIGFEPIPEATIVPMLFARMRELRDEDGDRQVLCYSRDSVTGVGDPGGVCESCPLGKWAGSKEEGNRRAPLCNFNYSYIIYSVEHDAVASLSFSRSGLGAAKMMNTIIAQKGLGKCAISLKPQTKQGPKGTYFVPGIGAAMVDSTVFDRAKVRAAGGV